MTQAGTLHPARPFPTGDVRPGEAGIREIVFASDLSPASDRAFEHCRMLANRLQAQVVLYHLIEAHADGAPLEVQEERFRRAELTARQHLEHRASTLDVPTQITIERGSSVRDSVADLLATARADLVVMATHGREGVAHFVFGSVVEQALRRAHPPVLCVREPEHGAALPYRRVLVPTDLSDGSRRAFPIAALLAQQFGAEVVAFHAVAPPRPPLLSGLPEIVETRVPSDQDLASFLLPEFLGARLTPRIALGSAWDLIIRTAQEERADVIVMSTRGRRSLTDHVLGSHTERVIRHAPCPVLVV